MTEIVITSIHRNRMACKNTPTPTPECIEIEDKSYTKATITTTTTTVTTTNVITTTATKDKKHLMKKQKTINILVTRHHKQERFLNRNKIVINDGQ